MSDAVKTVRVRIAVKVSPDGSYSAFGYSLYDEEKAVADGVFIDDLPEGEVLHWVEADIPVPMPITVAGTLV